MRRNLIISLSSAFLLLTAVSCNKDENNGIGTYNGHEYVDMGLPSGILWATCNLGAEEPHEYGLHFAWGEVTTKTNYEWGNYTLCNGAYNKLTKYCNVASYGDNGFVDDLIIVEADDDVVVKQWGEGWRMPTYTDMLEFQSYTNSEWTEQNGVKGRLFTSRVNGNTLFMPASGTYKGTDLKDKGTKGYYWAGEINSINSPHRACSLEFDESEYFTSNCNYRCYGQTIRPIHKP